MEKNITIESIRNKSYEEMSREEKQFFCENAHLLCEDTQEDNGIIIVDDIDSYISKRNLVNVSELESKENLDNHCVDLETARKIIMDAILPLCKWTIKLQEDLLIGLFHCKNLRGAAAITIFTLENLYCLDTQKAILKGDITFNGEQLYGSIIVDMTTHDVIYNYKGKSPRYKLTIDPSKKQLWDKLITQLDLALKSRTT